MCNSLLGLWRRAGACLDAPSLLTIAGSLLSLLMVIVNQVSHKHVQIVYTNLLAANTQTRLT